MRGMRVKEWRVWRFLLLMSVRTAFSIGEGVGIDFNETSLVSEGNESKCRSGV